MIFNSIVSLQSWHSDRLPHRQIAGPRYNFDVRILGVAAVVGAFGALVNPPHLTFDLGKVRLNLLVEAVVAFLKSWDDWLHIHDRELPCRLD